MVIPLAPRHLVAVTYQTTARNVRHSVDVKLGQLIRHVAVELKHPLDCFIGDSGWSLSKLNTRGNDARPQGAS